MENTPETHVYFYGKMGSSKMPRLPWFAEKFSEAYYLEMESFVDAIANDRDPSPNEEDGLRACILSEAAKKSAMEKRPINIEDLI